MPTASEIAQSLGASLTGPDINVVAARSLGSADQHSVVFLSRTNVEEIAHLNKIGAVLCVAAPDVAPSLTCSTIVHADPRYAFCLVLARYFAPVVSPGIATNATIHDSAQIGSGAVISDGARIGTNVDIGDRTVIGENCVILDGCRIGSDCVIKANTTIGASGFGFTRDPEGHPVAFPHIGSVLIGNRVEIGANCTVVRATLDLTSVGDEVKTDDHVHIAHNDIIGARSFIAAGAILSGSVKIGEEVWIGPNATVSDGISVGDRARIGIASLVTRDVEPGVTVFGNPARKLATSER